MSNGEQQPKDGDHATDTMTFASPQELTGSPSKQKSRSRARSIRSRLRVLFKRTASPIQRYAVLDESAAISKQQQQHSTARTEALDALDNATFSNAHITAILVAGSGFFVDSYDNFVIGLIVPMIAYEYYGKSSLPSSTADGWVKGASSWGNAVGQISFAILGDILGRKKIYGVELLILISGALLCALASWPVNNNPDNLLIMLSFWRFFLGVGIGGDYPVSAVITSEFASSKRRGTMIATVFGMQGFGIITGAVMAILVLATMKHSIINDGVSQLGYCWRFLAGFGAIPAMAAVYWRLHIPETPRFAMDVLNDEDYGAKAANQFLNNGNPVPMEDSNEPTHRVVGAQPKQPNKVKNGFFDSFALAFRSYFYKWANLKILLGCAAAWFFLDIGYYGTSLNTPVVLDIIGYGGKPHSEGNQRVYEDLWNRAVGTTLINLLGTVPGYWVTAALVDKWGRKPIQNLGFIMLTILFLVLAIFLNDLRHDHTTLFVVIYAFAQFFFNFGPNATTFIIPAEIFPTAVRSTGHGISAASGKFGAILAAQGFSMLASSSVGLTGVLYIFSACCFVGLLFSCWVPETKGLTLEQLSDRMQPMDMTTRQVEVPYEESRSPRVT